MTDTPTNNRAVSFWEALFLLFLGLNMAGEISWPWYCIAMPLFVQMALGAATAVLIAHIRKRSAMGEWLGPH
jgi:hypothetical protein